MPTDAHVLKTAFDMCGPPTTVFNQKVRQCINLPVSDLKPLFAVGASNRYIFRPGGYCVSSMDDIPDGQNNAVARHRKKNERLLAAKRFEALRWGQ